MTLNKLKYFCINLASRKDRWFSVSQEFKKAKLQIKRFPGVVSKKYPWHGCTMSHYKILKTAKKNNLPRICVFEDDIRIVDQVNFSKKIKEIIDELPKDWNILYLGGLAGRDMKLKKMNKNIYKVEGLMCTYGIVYNKKSYNNLIKILGKTSRDSYSTTFIKGYKAIDDYLSKEYQKKYHCYVVWPFLIEEIDKNYSDIENKIKNTSKNYRYKFLLHKIGIGWVIRILGRVGDFLCISTRYKNKKNQIQI